MVDVPPVSDVAVGNWTPSTALAPLYTMVDEGTVDDADYIRSGASPFNDRVVFKLGSMYVPPPGDVYLIIRHRDTP
jgi:hypothetical protein